MRILDCKERKCNEITKNAPIILDYMCEECDTHFDSVKKYLTALNIPFTVDPGIVRGLYYYTKTIFEILNNSLMLHYNLVCTLDILNCLYLSLSFEVLKFLKLA